MKITITAILISVMFLQQAQAADWQACKRQKIEVIKLEQALGQGKKLKGYGSGAAMKQARRDKEDWLWKHCRYYSNRLRNLERDRM